MRDELSHIRNQPEERRQQVLEQHKRDLDRLYALHPQLKALADKIQGAKLAVVSLTLAKLKGEGVDQQVVQAEEKLRDLQQQRKDLLAQLGLDASQLEPRWHCQRCQDTGKYYSQDGRMVSCPCHNQFQAELRRRQVGLPRRLAKAGFDQVNFDLYQPQHRPQAQKIFAYVRSYCDRLLTEPNGQGLFVHGTTGSGKSYLLGCIANYLCQRLAVKYVVYADFLDMLRATFGNREGFSTEYDLVDEVKNVDLLLLDDLGVEKPTEFALKHLAQIIDYRYRNFKPVVVSSNFTLEELKNRTEADMYGERIVWRLIECSTILNLQGNIRMNL